MAENEIPNDTAPSSIPPKAPASVRSKLRRVMPWVLLLLGLAIFYDINPLYPLLLQAGINAHLPIPNTVDESWNESTKPAIGKSESDKSASNPPITVVNSSRGPIKLQTFMAPDADLGVIYIGGIGGGFDSPAKNVYTRLGCALREKGISSVHLCFRKLSPFPETVHDVRAAVAHLNQTGHKRVILVSHSLGSASAICAASFEPSVVGVAAMSSQPYGANRVTTFGSKRLLVITGLLDVVEPPCWSSAIYKQCPGDKEIAYFLGSHPLDECGDAVYERIFNWILKSS